MASTIETLEGLERRLHVEIEQEQFEKAYQDKLQSVAKTASIKGFRPGKTPMKVIEQRFGKSIKLEVANELMQSSFEEAIKKHELNIAGMPKVEPKDMENFTTVEYDATFEVYPEITLKDLTDVTIDKPVAEVSEEDINKVVENLQKQNAEWEMVDRAAQDGDRVTIDFEGFIDEKPFEGGSAEGFALELGSKQMIPGFEEGIVGAQVEETCDVNVTFPEEYPVKDLAGKPALFKVTVHKVEAGKLPEIDDALAEKANIEGGLAGLEAHIRETLQRELDEALKNQLKEAVMNKLIELNPIEIPKALLDEEVTHLQNMTRQQMAYSQGKTELPEIDLPRDPYEAEARKRVIIGLLIAEVIKSNDIKLDADAVRARIERIAEAYGQSEEVVEWYYKNQQMRSDVEAYVLEDQAVEKLLEKAVLSEVEHSFEDIMNKSNKQQ